MKPDAETSHTSAQSTVSPLQYHEISSAQGCCDTLKTPCGKTDRNSTSASHVVKAWHLRPKCAEETRHAQQSSHMELTRNTVFSCLLHLDLASTAKCPCCLFAVSAAQSSHMGGRHFERWSRTLSDQFWRVQSRLLFTMGHVSRDHEFAGPVPPQSIHEDVCTSVGGLDQTGWNVTIVVHIGQTHAAEVGTERHTVSHNITVFVSTLRTQKFKQSSSH